MRELAKNGTAQCLTIEAARKLEGKTIQTFYYGCDSEQDYTETFTVGKLVSEWEYYRNLKEDCYPDKNGFKNRTEYWESFMSQEQINRSKNQLELLRSDGTPTYIRYTPEDDYDNDHYMWCSDVDRIVRYIILY